MAMRDEDFETYRALLKARSGLIITPDKAYLLESRLTPVARKWEKENLADLAAVLRGTINEDIARDVVEAMTTNETSFFRDQKPFDLFTNTVLPHFLKKRDTSRKIRIWCAACSSGQEPYSLAMLTKEKAALLSGWQVELLATDISHDILEIAKKATYSQFEVQRGMPIQMLMKYFTQDGDYWTVKDELRQMISYRYFNLLDDMRGLGTFDIIFCRNVLIYFDEATKADILTRLAAQLTDDGFLYLGGAETVMGITDSFKPLDNYRGLYIKPAAIENFTELAQAVG